MTLRYSVNIVITIVGYVAVAIAQETRDQELARQLATEATRQHAVAVVVKSAQAKTPLLLLWTRQPPPYLDQHELFVGLADAFGQLREKAAIPFLIANISIQRWRDVNTWLKTPAIIEHRMPAIGALVRIGADASHALIDRYAEPMTNEDRLACIFVVARIGDPEAQLFLQSVVAQAKMDRYWAEYGIEHVEDKE